MISFKELIEKVELEEAKIPVEHAVKAVTKVLGSQSAAKFATHLKPGTEKHTDWNLINKALMNQGVKSQHIAKIAVHLKPAHYEEVEIEEGLADDFLAMAKQRNPNARISTTDQRKKEADELAKKREGLKPVHAAPTGNARPLGGHDPKSGRSYSEEVENIDELKKSTLGSYVKKASKEVADNAWKAGTAEHPDLLQRGKLRAKAFFKAKSRMAGIDKATDRLAKEEVELDEAAIKVGDVVVWNKGKTAQTVGKVHKIEGDHYILHHAKTNTYHKVPKQGSQLAESELDEAKGALTYKPEHAKWGVVPKSSKEFVKFFPKDKEADAKAHAEKTGGTLKKIDQAGRAMKEEIEQVDEISTELKQKYLGAATKKHLQQFLGRAPVRGKQELDKRRAAIQKTSKELTGKTHYQEEIEGVEEGLQNDYVFHRVQSGYWGSTHLDKKVVVKAASKDEAHAKIRQRKDFVKKLRNGDTESWRLKEEVEIDEALDFKKEAAKHMKDMHSKDATPANKAYAQKMLQRALEASKMKDKVAATKHYMGEDVDQDEVMEGQLRNFSPHSDLAGRGRLPSYNKTAAGKKREADRETERLKDKMKFTKSQGGIAGPKGKLPEEAELDEAVKKKLAIGSKVSHPEHGKGTVVMHSLGGGTSGTVVKFANGKKMRVDHKKLAMEEVELDEQSVPTMSHKAVMNKIKSGTHEAMSDVKPGKHVELRHTETGKRTTVYVKEDVDQKMLSFGEFITK